MVETIEIENRIYYFALILGAVNELIERGKIFINTKRIREILNIKSKNRSKINFIWRSLEYLEEHGYLKIYSAKTPKVYRLPKEKIVLRCK